MICSRHLQVPRVVRSIRLLINCFCTETSISNTYSAPSTGTVSLTAHLAGPDSHIHPDWIHKLEALEKPAARNLVEQLIPGNALGYDQNSSKRVLSRSSKSAPVKSGSLLHFITEQKRLHPTKILLVRVGDFYETYGLDAVLLVEYVGLAPMGGKAKAGCPTGNIQQTLDRLMEPGGGSRPGFVVAVFEEGLPTSAAASVAPPPVDIPADTPAGKGKRPTTSTTKSAMVKLKPRFLAQVVSPGQPTYLSDLCLKSVDIEFAPNKPFVGISKSTSDSGYTLSVAHVDDRLVRVYSRLSLEGLKALLLRVVPVGTGGAGVGVASFLAEPVYIQNITSVELRGIFRLPSAGGGSVSASASFGNSRSSFSSLQPAVEVLTGYTDILFPDQVLRRVVRLLARPESDLARFRVSASVTRPHEQCTPRPVYVSTALQVGLLPNPNIPELVPQLLSTPHGPTGARRGSNAALCGEFLRNYLMAPPPLETANYMRVLCHSLASLSVSHRPSEPACVKDGYDLDRGSCTDVLSVPGIPLFYSSVSGVGTGTGGRLMIVGKVTALLEAEQCNVVLFQQILDNVRAVLGMLRQSEVGVDHLPILRASDRALSTVDIEQIVTPNTCVSFMNCAMQQLVARTLGTAADDVGSVTALQANCERIADQIKRVVYQPGSEAYRGTIGEAIFADPYGNIPGSFFHSNEHSFRLRVSTQHKEYRRQLGVVADAAAELSRLVQQELETRYSDGLASADDLNILGADIGHDMINNRIFFEPLGRKRSAKGSSKAPVVDPTEAETRSQERAKSALSVRLPIHDKRGAVIANRYTTAAVSTALSAYLSATENTTRMVERLLKELSANLCADMQTLREVALWNVIMCTAVTHVRLSIRRHWRLPDKILPLRPAVSSGCSERVHSSTGILRLPGLIPYWMDSKLAAVTNDITMGGIFLLTAPNMSGKSTLMRAVLTACLLGNCGLFVPCVRQEGAPQPVEIPVYNNYFLRTTSYDVPVSNQSAFALEMDDMEVLLRECCSGENAHTDAHTAHEDLSPAVPEQRSLVMIDELGKGTSSRDGASLAGAIIEELSQPRHNIMGIFATHLHELFLLPLRFSARDAGADPGVPAAVLTSQPVSSSASAALPAHVQYKTMQVRAPVSEAPDGHIHSGCIWTYRMVDGICTDSMALHTARYCRLPARLLRRAEELSRVYDDEIFNFRDKLSRVQANMEDRFAPVGVDAVSGTGTEGARLGFSTLEELLPAVLQVAEHQVAHCSVIEADQTPPPGLEGQCCVYILQLRRRPTDPPTFYVGESAAISQRLAQWRRVYSDHVSPRALIIQLNGGGNRSMSQQIETKLLQQLKIHYNVDIFNSSADENRKVF